MDVRRCRQDARRQLDERYEWAKFDELGASPPFGWVRAVREALGMSTRRLASRLGVAQPTVVQLEQAEASGGLRLATLRRAAAALECDLVYVLVPRDGSLERTVASHARRRARGYAPAGDEAAVDRIATHLASSDRLWDD